MNYLMISISTTFLISMTCALPQDDDTTTQTTSNENTNFGKFYDYLFDLSDGAQFDELGKFDNDTLRYTKTYVTKKDTFQSIDGIPSDSVVQHHNTVNPMFRAIQPDFSLDSRILGIFKFPKQE